MLQLSLVAFYTEKPAVLTKVLNTCRELIQGSLADLCFRPYIPEQIHTTLIGMEMFIKGSVIYNKNFFEKSGEYHAINLSAFHTIISGYFPMNIRIGGFTPDYKQFLSSNLLPFERSFSFNTKTGKLVVIGWPHTDNDFRTFPLMNFRNEVGAQCNIAHKYPNDNDLYMVLGEMSGDYGTDSETKEKSEQNIKKLNTEIRNYLSQNPADIALSPDDLYLVKYSDPRLPSELTKTYRLVDHWNHLPDFIRSLYGQSEQP